MAVSVKRSGSVLAACDKSLLGKQFEEKELVLDVNEGFYKGELVREDEFCRMLAEADNINLVGEETIKLAKKAGVVGSVGRVKRVPYAVIFRV